MSSLPAPSDTSPLTNDFEWPPTADNLSVHEIEADPWQTMDDDVHETIVVTVVIEAPAATPLPSPPRPR